MLLDLLTVAVLAFVGARLVTTASAAVRSEALRGRTMELLRALRLRHFARAPLVIVAVVATAGLLLEVPGLDWGWWTAIGGTGNVIVGGSERSSIGALQWIAPVVFVGLLIPLMPLFAEREERMFRLGAESWSGWRRVRRAFEFGLVHLIMGIPIGVALALAVGGGYFTWAYLRGYRSAAPAGGTEPRGGRAAGLLESTCSHLAYNLVIVGVVLLSLVLAAFGV